jgi:pyruvate formate-lyase activating enzyme-like uncharacterized protein
MDDLMLMELELELKILRKEIAKLEKENKELRGIINDNDLGDEVGIERPITPEEEICILGIEQILDAVKNKIADKNDISNYDILHRNLRMIRGFTTESKKKVKKADVKDLLKIVEGKGNG